MYLAIDIGGTKTLVAVFSEKGEIIEKVKFETPQNYEDFLRALENTVAKMTTKKFSSGAIGTRGLVDREKGIFISDDILPWKNVELVKYCSDLFNCMFLLENDAKAAGFAEADALKEYRNVLYITVSTGIGTATVKNGNIVESLRDMEMGKIPVEYENKVQPWEDFASGKAIFERYGKKASEIIDQSTWDEISGRIGYGVAICCCILQPDVIVFGGGAGQYADKFIPGVKKYLDENIGDAVRHPQAFMRTKYAEDGVIHGCYKLIRRYAETN